MKVIVSPKQLVVSKKQVQTQSEKNRKLLKASIRLKYAEQTTVTFQITHSSY